MNEQLQHACFSAKTNFVSQRRRARKLRSCEMLTVFQRIHFEHIATTNSLSPHSRACSINVSRATSGVCHIDLCCTLEQADHFLVSGRSSKNWIYKTIFSPERQVTEFKMLFTIDWENGASTESQALNYSGGDMTTSAAASGSRVTSDANPYNIALIVIGVLGTVTNGLVLGGFWYAGRAKMNVSGAHIANHTTLDLFHSF